MSWKFWKKDPNPMDPQVLLAQAHSAVQDQPRVQDTVPFQLPVEDVFSITGRGTVVTGRVSGGVVRTGDQVQIVRNGQPVATSRITGVEAFRKKLTEGHAGDNVGLLLQGIAKDDVHPGDVITH